MTIDSVSKYNRKENFYIGQGDGAGVETSYITFYQKKKGRNFPNRSCR